MYNMKTLFLALLLISLVVVPAFAKRHGWGPPVGNDNRQEERVEQLSMLLDLSPEQEAEIKEIITETRQKSNAQRDAEQANRQEIQTLVSAEALNESRLRELAQEQADLRVDRMIDRHTTRNRINQILTPEQQEKHQALRQMRPQHKKTGKTMRPDKEAKAM